MIVHVWREILKRNLSPRDICRVAQTCKLLNRLCKEQSVWEPFGTFFDEIRKVNIPRMCCTIRLLRHYEKWFFPYATNIMYVFNNFIVAEIRFNFKNCAFWFQRTDDHPFYIMSITIEPFGLTGCGAVEFNANKFWRTALQERCTPQWMWENNPLVKHARENGGL
jgi:hypothetical protein